jgi:hypothetical protein
MTYAPWDGTSASTGDSSYQLAFVNENGVNASGVPGLKLRNGINSTWNSWNTIIHSNNVGSYALPIGGGTLTGNRQMVFDTDGGAIRIRGNSGGWSMGTYYEGSSGTTRAGFGAYGGGNDLTWAWIGLGYESPWMTINSSNTVFYNSVLPSSNGTLNLGSSSLRWDTVFTSDLSMSNGIGDYTIVEGEEDLFIYNNKTNKVFKFLLQEVDPSIVPPKKV